MKNKVVCFTITSTACEVKKGLVATPHITLGSIKLSELYFITI